LKKSLFYEKISPQLFYDNRKVVGMVALELEEAKKFRKKEKKGYFVSMSNDNVDMKGRIELPCHYWFFVFKLVPI